MLVLNVPVPLIDPRLWPVVLAITIRPLICEVNALNPATFMFNLAPASTTIGLPAGTTLRAVPYPVDDKVQFVARFQLPPVVRLETVVGFDMPSASANRVYTGVTGLGNVLVVPSV